MKGQRSPRGSKRLMDCVKVERGGGGENGWSCLIRREMQMRSGDKRAERWKAWEGMRMANADGRGEPPNKRKGLGGGKDGNEAVLLEQATNWRKNGEETGRQQWKRLLEGGKGRGRGEGCFRSRRTGRYARHVLKQQKAQIPRRGP